MCLPNTYQKLHEIATYFALTYWICFCIIFLKSIKHTILGTDLKKMAQDNGVRRTIFLKDNILSSLFPSSQSSTDYVCVTDKERKENALPLCFSHSWITLMDPNPFSYFRLIAPIFICIHPSFASRPSVHINPWGLHLKEGPTFSERVLITSITQGTDLSEMLAFSLLWG